MILLPTQECPAGAEKLVGKVLFHISDEPDNSCLENYISAFETVEEFFRGYMHGDALWDYSFYEKGILKSPIVGAASIYKFLGKCDNLWAYYTGNEISDNLHVFQLFEQK